MSELKKEMSEMRREFHKMPEPGWLEFETTVKLIDILKDLGFDLKYGKEIHGTRMGLPSKERMKEHADELDLERDYDISEILNGYTGVLADFDTGREGPYIGIRFDIDANDVRESMDDDHRPYKENFISKNNFAMHACGHDGHMTIGLFVAKWIVDNKDKLNGRYRLIFQPAEEGVRGARSIVESGALKGLDYFIGGHIGLGVGSDIISLGTTGFLATTKWDIEYKGIPAHAGNNPEAGRNALLAGASCALNLHTLTQYSTGMARVNVGRMEAGTGRNVVPANAKLVTEIRGETEEIKEDLNKRLEEVVIGTSKSFGVDYSLENVGAASAYVGYDEELIDGIKDYIKNKDKDYKIETKFNFNASEDVTTMMVDVENDGGRVLHIMYGSDIAAGHHNDKFDFDEQTLVNAYDILTEILLYLNEDK